ncbi:hypothetical protein L1887_14280 [Cichorium endivia]|nr:hypothetical protein L1887_14280 [Cichorium endivia]
MKEIVTELESALEYQQGDGNPYSTDDEGNPYITDDEDVYFDDESAEVVLSSLRLGDDEKDTTLFTNQNWFAFPNDDATTSTSGNAPNTN